MMLLCSLMISTQETQAQSDNLSHLKEGLQAPHAKSLKSSERVQTNEVHISIILTNQARIDLINMTKRKKKALPPSLTNTIVE